MQIKKSFMLLAVFLLVVSNLLTVLPQQIHAEDNTGVTPAAVDACPAPVALINGSFEQGPAKGSAGAPYFFLESEVPGWKTTDNASPTGQKVIEIWNHRQDYPAGVKNYPAPPDGNRWAELNAYENGMLYQDVKTTPGQTIYWRLSHMGRGGVDTMQLRIGAATANPYDTVVQRKMSDGNTKWGTYTGAYTVPAGQTTTRFGFEAVSVASGSIGAGNFLDDIFLGTEPCVTANKTVSPQGEVHAGDELTYSVQVKNEGGDIASNANFSDLIPEGTEYVPGSLKLINGSTTKNLTDAADNDEGHFDGKKVNAKLGNLPNTTQLPNGVTVQFKVKTKTDYAVTKVNNKAQINYNNLLTNKNEQTESNEVTTPIIFNEPKLESKKTASIQQKAAGNTDADHPEVGDTLLYTIQTRNTLEDSQVKNLVISDAIPEGLEYVPGTLKVDGTAVSDAKDGDKGHYADGKAAGQFGNVNDTEWHTVTFEAKVKSGQSGKDIVNTANVTGDNIDKPDKPNHEVKVYPRDPVLESEKTAKNLDADKEKFEVGDTVVYTIKTRNKITESTIEDLTISDKLPAGLTYVEGSLKASNGGEAKIEDGKITANFGDVTDTEWRTVTFEAKIESGYIGKTIENVANVDGGNIDDPDKPGTDIKVEPKDPKLESKKTASLQEKAEGNKDADHPESGDTLLYTIQTRNTIEDSLVKNLVISDAIPEGLEYIPGTLIVDGTAVTDDQDDDQGHHADGKVAGQFGDVADTKWHTVTFEVKVKSGQAGKDIVNTATIGSDNVDKPDKPSHEVKVYPRDPILESEKTAKNLDSDKNKYEAGDTVVYTIKTRNTVTDSLVENLTISDKLPAGLTYVEGSLKASNGGEAKIEDGKITANFGDVTDTEWRTVTFEAKIESGYAGKTIKNVAVAGGDNVETPGKPGTDIKVDPKEPKLESEKTAKNLDSDKDKYEAGDTVVYTIKTRNTVTDSLVENLTISDKLPAGLTYVEGSLKASNGGEAKIEDGKITANFGDVTDTEWRTVTFEAKIESGYAGKTIKNVAVAGGDNVKTPDKPGTSITVEPKDPDPEKPSEPNKPNKPEKPTDQKTDGGNELPNTATDTFNLLLAGLVLLLAGTGLWYFRRKRNV
ncbi:isopeptide-forming domain-containing fimbrial protein [Bacillus sonorensis]|uniref:isopeptide-forming domain-containing fimbrial protein n=2 Tax=Bacillus sonorensis TaxID=119858 RepID=UPI00227F9E7F|nr:isopeptide-forming domain-containing fimbrial protein [Bacillus sonorensis]MCY7858338.1 isopeptide-forming domain-containing fimbrial protein [Bacillus sonorensis]MCY8606937.1 isopeptide-forming domain-containing fimbrial protein [Bacillus sonorensis]